MISDIGIANEFSHFFISDENSITYIVYYNGEIFISEQFKFTVESDEKYSDIIEAIGHDIQEPLKLIDGESIKFTITIPANIFISTPSVIDIYMVEDLYSRCCNLELYNSQVFCKLDSLFRIREIVNEDGIRAIERMQSTKSRNRAIKFHLKSMDIITDKINKLRAHCRSVEKHFYSTMDYAYEHHVINRCNVCHVWFKSEDSHVCNNNEIGESE